MADRRLIVMRHAKSDWDSDAKTDHERPLNGRGKREAPQVGKLLKAKGYVPDAALVSDAARTRETWERIQDEFPATRVLFDPVLYLGGIDALRRAIPKAPRDASTIVVLGHNPGSEEIVRELSNQTVELKTAYAAVLRRTEGDESWETALGLSGGFSLVEVVTPT